MALALKNVDIQTKRIKYWGYILSFSLSNATYEININLQITYPINIYSWIRFGLANTINDY